VQVGEHSFNHLYLKVSPASSLDQPGSILHFLNEPLQGFSTAMVTQKLDQPTLF